jgi:hypothetical protein
MLVATPPRTSVVRRAAGDEPVPRMIMRGHHEGKGGALADP